LTFQPGKKIAKPALPVATRPRIRSPESWGRPADAAPMRVKARIENFISLLTIFFFIIKNEAAEILRF